MKYIPIQCKSVIRKVKGRFPYLDAIFTDTFLDNSLIKSKSRKINLDFVERITGF